MILSDYQPHSKGDLIACLNDELSVPSNLRRHLSGLRKAIRPIGKDIFCACRKPSGWNYILVNMLKVADQGQAIS